MGFLCAVCKTILTIKTPTSLAPCGHVGHTNCWISRSNSCSLCPKCTRTFWRDYLKPVLLEEEEMSITEPSPTQTATSSSGVAASNTIAVTIHDLQRELEALKNIVYRNDQTENDEVNVIKTEHPDIDTPTTIINANINWDSLNNGTIKQVVDQQHVGQIVGQLASAFLPASFSLKTACTEKIFDSVNKFSSNTSNGFELNLSMRKRPSRQRIFRLDVDMSGDVSKGEDASVTFKEQSLTAIELNLSEPDGKVQRIKFSMNTD